MIHKNNLLLRIRILTNILFCRYRRAHGHPPIASHVIHSHFCLFWLHGGRDLVRWRCNRELWRKQGELERDLNIQYINAISHRHGLIIIINL